MVVLTSPEEKMLARKMDPPPNEGKINALDFAVNQPAEKFPGGGRGRLSGPFFGSGMNGRGEGRTAAAARRRELLIRHEIPLDGPRKTRGGAGFDVGMRRQAGRRIPRPVVRCFWSVSVLPMEASRRACRRSGVDSTGPL